MIDLEKIGQALKYRFLTEEEVRGLVDEAHAFRALIDTLPECLDCPRTATMYRGVVSRTFCDEHAALDRSVPPPYPLPWAGIIRRLVG